MDFYATKQGVALSELRAALQALCESNTKPCLGSQMFIDDALRALSRAVDAQAHHTKACVDDGLASVLDWL